MSEVAVVLYGRVTYQLMQFWQRVLENPSGEKSMDDFAKAMDKVPKLVFSHSLQDTGWESATLSNQGVENALRELKKRPGKDILIGSRSLLLQLMRQNLIDEYQICVHPVIAGEGLVLFENTKERVTLKLIKTKTFKGGALVFYYEPTED